MRVPQFGWGPITSGVWPPRFIFWTASTEPLFDISPGLFDKITDKYTYNPAVCQAPLCVLKAGEHTSALSFRMLGNPDFKKRFFGNCIPHFASVTGFDLQVIV